MKDILIEFRLLGQTEVQAYYDRARIGIDAFFVLRVCLFSLFLSRCFPLVALSFSLPLHLVLRYSTRCIFSLRLKYF